MSSPPMRKINWGGILLIIVLVSHYQGTKDVFGNQYKKYAGYKTVDSIKPRPVFPGKLRVFIEVFRVKQKIYQKAGRTYHE
jgi:hypothetical protein